MGTSSSYTAPTSGGWPSAKGAMTRFIRAGGGGGGGGGVIGSAVQARGGVKASANRAAGGRQAGARLGSFFSGVAQNGLEATLAEHGLENLIGKDLNTVLDGVMTYIAGDSALAEDSIARDALDHLFQNIEVQANLKTEDPSAFFEGIITQVGVWEIVIGYVSEYVYIEILRELGDKLAIQAPTEPEALRLQEDLHEDIRNRVLIKMENQPPDVSVWSRSDINQLMEKVFEDAYGCWALL